MEVNVERLRPFSGLVTRCDGDVVKVDICGRVHLIKIPRKWAVMIGQVLREKGRAWVQVKARYDCRGFVRSYSLMVR